MRKVKHIGWKSVLIKIRLDVICGQTDINSLIYSLQNSTNDRIYTRTPSHMSVNWSQY